MHVITRVLLVVALLCIATVHCDSSAEDDSGERRRPLPPRRHGDDSSEEDDDDDDDDRYPPRHWVDALHPQKPQILRLVYLDNHVAIYFDRGVNRSAKWPFQMISDAWRYVEWAYGPFVSDEEPWLWLKVHSWKVEPQVVPSQSNDGRNVIDVSATNREVVDVVVELMAKLVESSVKAVNFTHLLCNVPRPWPVIVYDIYRNTSSSCAEKWLKQMKTGADKDEPTSAENSFTRWFHPIYTHHKGVKVLNRFFKLVADLYMKDKAGPMRWEEFVHFWSGAADIDLRLLLTSAFQMQLNDKEIEKSRKKFANILYCTSKI